MAPAPARAAKSDVKIGLCASKDFDKAKAAGFDYVELGVRNFATLPDGEWKAFQESLKASGLKAPVANLFLPTDMKVVGPGVEKEADKQMEYVKRAFERSQALGIKVIVFGSGGSRMVPDGFSKDEAMKQLIDFAKRISPEAKKRGIVIAVEPLRRQETNIINSAAEGAEWVNAVKHPSFQLMIDFYHLAIEKEDPEIVLKVKRQLKHIHIANPTGRVYPLDSGEADYASFFKTLNKIGYRGGISVEASTKNFDEEAPKTIAFLRSAYADAGKPAKGAARDKPATAPPAKEATAKK